MHTHTHTHTNTHTHIYITTYLRETKIKKGLSTPTAGMFVTDKPMRDRQKRLQRPQLKIWSGVDCIVLRFFFQRLLFFRSALRVFLRKETTWLVMRCQVSRFLAMVDRITKDFFKQSFKSFFRVPPSRWPAESSQHGVILGRRWFPIRDTSSAQRSRTLVALLRCWWPLTFQGLHY